MLTEGDLRGIRSTVESSFPDVVVRRRFTTTTDEYNEEVRGDPLPDVTYAGRLVWRDTSEQTSDGQAERIEPSVLLPHDADVVSSDQIIAGGYTFEVAAPPMQNPSPGQSTHLRVALRHLDG